MADSREGLIAVLQLAYSGERAAGYAYRGHWRSLRDPGERERVRRIEDEEWHHRRQVGDMLEALGSRPSRIRELRALPSSGGTSASTSPRRASPGSAAATSSSIAC
jgi:demethoxyubiquinone hydroxylase (CLK1/Coq7/Cat5 family)